MVGCAAGPLRPLIIGLNCADMDARGGFTDDFNPVTGVCESFWFLTAEELTGNGAVYAVLMGCRGLRMDFRSTLPGIIPRQWGLVEFRGLLSKGLTEDDVVAAGILGPPDGSLCCLLMPSCLVEDAF